MATYRTAMGKAVDMTSLVSKNEKVRAVGNMKVNARGDTIDAMGRVVIPVTDKVNDAYSRTVGNKSAQVKPKQSVKLPVDNPELSEIEKELESSMENDVEVEKIKAAEKK